MDINRQNIETLSTKALAKRLCANQLLCEESLAIQSGDCTLRIRSNSLHLLNRLKHYFADIICQTDTPAIEIIAIEQDALQLDIDFLEWKREPGKQNRKDSHYDLPGARLLRKVRTGMVFLQSETHRIAVGPCIKNDNQVINFINAQYMNWLQQRDWLICHAAGLEKDGQAMAIAGFSGGGKSTLMLHMLEYDNINFVSNDRLFIHHNGTTTGAAGIPKLPRINPGTIMHNHRLRSLIPEERHAELFAMPQKELWELEEKYDVQVDELYGAGRITANAPLKAFIILNWKHDCDQPTQLNKIDINQRRDLLAALMKSPGPFYQNAHGQFLPGSSMLDETRYIQTLEGVDVFEISGKVDFDCAAIKLHEILK